MPDLIGFWSYALAACAFASVTLWRLRARLDRSDQILLGACFTTAVWAMIAAVCGSDAPLAMVFGNLRSLVWVMLLYEMSAGVRSHSVGGLRLVFGAVALVVGLSLILSGLALGVALQPPEFEQVLVASRLLRITMSAGALVLVHNIYGQAAGESRVRIRGPMLGLTLMFGYDLNLATIAYLDNSAAGELVRLRGVFLALTAPFFTSTGGTKDSLKIKLSRAATFQSLSLIAICCYLAAMAVLAGALRDPAWNWGSAATAVLFLVLLAGASTLVLSERARGWMKVKLAKHLFEHRYDYRSEWLRFTEALGRSGPQAAPLGDRMVRAFAAIVDSPGGLLLVNDAGGSIAAAAEWNWPGANPPVGHPDAELDLLGARSKAAAGSSSSRHCAAAGAIRSTVRCRSRCGCSRTAASGPESRSCTTNGWWASSCLPRPNTGARSTGRISTCCARRDARPRARLPKRTVRKRCPTPSGSRNSIAALPSSSTT